MIERGMAMVRWTWPGRDLVLMLSAGFRVRRISLAPTEPADGLLELAHRNRTANARPRNQTPWNAEISWYCSLQLSPCSVLWRRARSLPLHHELHDSSRYHQRS